MNIKSTVAEVLHMPSVRRLHVGALSALAVLTIHADRLSGDVSPVDAHVTPNVLIAEPAMGPEATYQSAPASDQFGQAEEAELEKGVPAAIQNYIDHNTVIIDALGCSGSLIRNNRGIPVGALTAAHCIESDHPGEPSPLITGEDGKTYLFSSEPITLERGIDVTNLQAVGDVQEFVIPPKRSGIDQALAVLSGHRPGEVMRHYRQRLLSEEQLGRLHANKAKIWLSGYPYTQDGDEAGNMIRQEFPTTYIGQDTLLTEPTTRTEPAVLESVASATDVTNSNGAICSWGLSGGEGLVLVPAAKKHRKLVRSIGNFSLFASFSALQEKGGSLQSVSQEDAQLSTRYYHATFPSVEWEGIDAVCNYATEPIGKNHRLVYVTASSDLVPGQ